MPHPRRTTVRIKTAAGPASGTPAAFVARIKRLRAILPVAHFLVTNPVDVGYLTGFLGGDSYLLLGGRRPMVISDFRYEEELEPLKPFCDVVIRTKAMTDAVAAAAMELGVQRLGVQGEHMTLGLRQALGTRVRGVKLIETSGLVSRLRVKKDAGELALIRKAIRIQEQALEAVLPWIGKTLKATGSVSEQAIAAELEREMKVRGSSKPGFETIVGAGANGSLPHYRPGPFKLKRNQPLLIDWGAIFQGYHGDMTRVFCWGKWPAKIAEIYRIVQDAQEMSAAALRPGRTTVDVDRIARDYIAAHGYGERFGHGLGHGMGLDGHEEPRLSHMGEPRPLEPGMVVTIEPGIYLPGVGGVRIEDDYVITAKGAENLCTLPKSLAWATR